MERCSIARVVERVGRRRLPKINQALGRGTSCKLSAITNRRGAGEQSKRNAFRYLIANHFL
jgi:hypothetical protein